MVCLHSKRMYWDLMGAYPRAKLVVLAHDLDKVPVEPTLKPGQVVELQKRYLANVAAAMMTTVPGRLLVLDAELESGDWQERLKDFLAK